MAGRGLIEAEDTIANAHVFMLNKDGKWVPAKDPLHFDKTAAGVGLGRSFGIKMTKKNPDAIIGLIPCAVGGSEIDNWIPGSFFNQTKSYPWNDMEIRLKKAMKSGTLKGVLWHQGESDSSPDKCEEYKKKLENLIFRIRILSGNQKLPFVSGQFGKFFIKRNKKKYSDWNPSPAEIVEKSTRQVMKADGNAAFVTSKRLPDKGDKTHFDSKSYRILGKRYAKAMQKILGNLNRK